MKFRLWWIGFGSCTAIFCGVFIWLHFASDVGSLLHKIQLGGLAVLENNRSERSQERFQGWVNQKVRRDIIEIDLSLPGRVLIDGMVSVGAEVSGQISNVAVEEGDQVSEGQLLAEFDNQVFATRLQIATGQLEAARARLVIEKARQAFTERALGRRTSAPNELPAWSLEEIDSLQTELDVRNASVAVALADVQINEAIVRNAKIEIEKTRVVAPANGQITKSHIAQGETVVSIQSSPTLFELTRSDSKFVISAEIFEEYALLAKIGDSVSVRPSGGDGIPLEGCRLIRIFRQPVYRGTLVYFPALIECLQQGEQWWAGMSVEVDFTFLGSADRLLVPVEAFQFKGVSVGATAIRSPGFSTLWVEDRYGQIVERSIRTGLSDGLLSEVLEGDLVETDLIWIRAKNDT